MKQITRSYLEFLGITHVSTDGTIFTKRGPISPGNNRGYKYMTFTGIREGTKKHNIYVHNIVYAWHKGEIPYGYQVHHKDRNKSNNNIDNLIALTPEEHREEHLGENRTSIREEKCKLSVPRDWYVKKIEEAEALGTRSGSAMASHLRAKLRYYDAHIEEAIQKQNDFRDLGILNFLKKKSKEAGDKVAWKQYCRLIKNWKTLDPKTKDKIMNSIAKFL